MVSVKVLLFAIFREKYGIKETELEFDGTLNGFLKALGEKISPKLVEDIYDPDSKHIKSNLIVMINGRNIKDIKGDLKFNNGDTVAIFPPVAGG
ncbi:MAG: MoaD/ThiS family protein [Nitrososphaeria archaeon]